MTTAKRKGAGLRPRWRSAVTADDEAERIFAGYRRELFWPNTGLQDVFGVHPSVTASRSQGLRLLAIAHIENVPEGFDANDLMATIEYWKRELPEQEQGPEPLASDRKALDKVFAAARTLIEKLDRLTEAMAAPASRIADSGFGGPWPPERRDALRRELLQLTEASVSREVAEGLRRPNILPGKPPGGRSARETFLGYDLPMLYRQMFRGRRFTTNGKEDAPSSEGVRFACVVASEVLGEEVKPTAVVKARTRVRGAARGGQRGPR